MASGERKTSEWVFRQVRQGEFKAVLDVIAPTPLADQTYYATLIDETGVPLVVRLETDCALTPESLTVVAATRQTAHTFQKDLCANPVRPMAGSACPAPVYPV